MLSLQLLRHQKPGRRAGGSLAQEDSPTPALRWGHFLWSYSLFGLLLDTARAVTLGVAGPGHVHFYMPEAQQGALNTATIPKGLKPLQEAASNYLSTDSTSLFLSFSASIANSQGSKCLADLVTVSKNLLVLLALWDLFWICT